MRSPVRRRAFALLAATLLAFTAVAGVLANAPGPGSINASVSGSTATVSGTWSWPGIDQCDGRVVGWALDWGDPANPGNAIARGVAVGTRSDNTVSTNRDCGSPSGSKDRAGSWGSASHQYTAPGTYTICAVMYDVHVDGKGVPKDGELIAGGSGRNKDNSVEASQAPLGPGCTSLTIASPANISARKTVNKATADPGETLTYTIALANSGGTAGTVDVTDNISSLLAKASFLSASTGGTLGGSTVTWNGITVAAGGAVNLTLSVKLNTSGWTSGTTSLTNAVVVPGTTCTAGSTAPECRATTTVSTSANLVVRKSVDKSTAAPGDNLAYTITIQNTGAADATAVSASDNITALLARGTFLSATNGGSLSGSTVSWGNLAVNAGATITLGMTIKLNAAGWANGTTTLANTIVVPASDCAAGSSATSCRTSTAVSVAPNLVVRKSVDKTSAAPGETLTYTISLQNTGSGDAASVDVTDSISALLAHGTLLSASGGGILSGSTLSWAGQSLIAGASRSLTFAVRLDTSGWANGTTTLANTVVVPGSDCAPGSANPACRVATTVTARATLVVRKSVDKATADPGETLAYTITIQNTGNAGATAIDVTDDISALLAHGSFVSGSGSGTLTGSSVHWDNLAVGPGASQSLTFSVHLDPAGWPVGTTTLANTAVVSGSDCAAGAANSACRVSTAVTTRPILVVRKSVNVASADPGDSILYTVVVQNTGNAPATGVDVIDDISTILAHGSFVAASSGGSLVGSTVRWDNQAVAVGSSRSFTFTVKLDVGGWPAGTTALPNTVVVAGSDCASGSSNTACRVSTSVSPHFALSLTKNAAGGSSGPWVARYSATAGDTVWYQIRLTNTGNTTLTGVTLTDSMGIPAGQCAAVPSALTPGSGWTCVYFRTATEGSTTNTATADSAQTPTATDAATVVATPAPAPAIRIAKTASPAQLPVGGGNVTYTFVVTNPGNVALSNVTVTDDRCAPLTLQSGDGNSNNRLDTTESWRYTCGATLTVTTANTATVTATFGSTRVSASDKVTVSVLVGEPALHLDKSASPAQLPVGGGTANYTYVVTNVGNAALSGVTVSDDKCSPVVYVSGDTNNNNRLDLTETWRFACSATLTSTTTNHARASGSFGDIVAVDTDQATVSVAASAPAIHVVKAANPTSLPAGGGSVTYTYVVTNTGNTPLTAVGLRDDKCAGVTFLGGDTNSNSRLDGGETWQYRCVDTLTSTTTNTATASGTAGTATVTDTDQATVAVTTSSSAINVIKTANPVTLPPAGGSVTYTYLVTNKGNVALSNITVVDDKCDTVTLIGGDTNRNGRLDTTETWTYRCVATITQTTTNTALATGFSDGMAVTHTDTALVNVGTPQKHTARIGLTLTADPVVLPESGGPVTYTYSVSNKGDIALSSVTVADDSCSPVGAPTGDANANGLLDITETWTFTCVVTVSRTTTNSATASGQAEGQTVQALDMATVTLTPPAPTPTPVASPTASPDGSTGPVTPTGEPASPGTSASPGASGVGASPGSSGTPGSSGPGGSGGSSGGSVAGVTSPPRASGAPANSAEVIVNTGTTPSGMVMILILMLGIAAAVVIMTLSKRTSNS